MSRRVSVIIPIYNDPEGTRTTLKSLVCQKYDNYEILPVDNASTDETPTVIESFAESYPELVEPLEETEIQSSYAARNTGIEHARGEILAFIDADMHVEEDWLERLVGFYEETDCDYVGYEVVVTTTADPTIWERYERSLAFPVEEYLGRERYAPTCALLVERSVVDQVGRFDERLVSSGDREFGHRVHRAGFEQCFTDEVTAYHPARSSFDALRSKAVRIGRGREQVRRFHPELGNAPHPLDPFGVAPPNPFRVRRQFSEPTSVFGFFFFYLFEYVLKLFQQKGAIAEFIRLSRP